MYHTALYFCLYLFKTNIMKKLLYLFLTVLIVGCSSDDGGNADYSIVDKWYVVKYEAYEDVVVNEENKETK